MKFFAEPNLYVRIVNKHLRLRRMSGFHFDENGVYETEDATLIAHLKNNFRYEETPTEQDQVFKCTRCSFETDKQGVLLAHYRTHKKGV